nr:hypothetical protein RKHAN_00681 [Rhizobium sp. Khangiran2]
MRTQVLAALMAVLPLTNALLTPAFCHSVFQRAMAPRR